MASKIRFYVDEHVSRAVVRGLRQRGADVLRVPEAAMMEAEDEEHLALARAESRVIFTQDEDFLRLHAAGLEHAGIVYAPMGAPIGEIIRGLMLIHQILDAEDMVGQLEFL
jgi:uncharacterized protein with PIN domain